MFEFKDRVKIKELNAQGVVIAILEEYTGKTFKIRYFHNGEAKEVYFFDWEIEKC